MITFVFFIFTGREYLDTIQLYDYRNRTYSPKWGRFIEVDPIRFEGGDLNLYRYVRNWVMELIDPWGVDPGDKFNTQDGAAADASLYYKKSTIATGHEYCGGICFDGESYYATIAIEGSVDRCPTSEQIEQQQIDIACADDHVLSAVYHTHTLQTESYPSCIDYEFASSMHRDVYTYSVETDGMTLIDVQAPMCIEIDWITE